jgi:hypothetical protein
MYRLPSGRYGLCRGRNSKRVPVGSKSELDLELYLKSSVILVSWFLI